MTSTENTTKLVSKSFTGTWLGRAGASVQFARTKNTIKTCGERVSTMQWADEPDTITVRHIKGDGRNADFQTFAETTVATLAEAEAWAKDVLR